MPDNLEQQYQYELATDRIRRQKMLEVEAAPEQEKNEQEATRMGWGFFLFLLAVCLILDTIDAFTVGTLGWFTGIIGDLFLAVVSGMSKSGRKQFKKIIAGLLGETIPLINVLPLRTGFLIWGFVSSRSATLQQIGKMASLGQTKEGPAA